MDKITGRVGYLDGLRAVAIVGVLGIHGAGDYVVGGHLGVTIFFVLSGYLISSNLLRDGRRFGGKIDLRRFYLRRAGRLFPALVLAVIGTGTVYWATGLASTESVAVGAASALFYCTNALAAFGLVDLVEPFQWAWSLSLEEQFYLLWPLAIVAAFSMRRRIGRRWLFAIVAAGVIGPTVLRFLVDYPPGEIPVRVYFGPDSRVDALMIGCAIALMPIDGLSKLRKGVGASFLTVAVVVLILAFFEGDLLSSLTFIVWLPVVGIATAAIIVFGRAMPSSTVVKALSLGPIRWLGEISYGLYLWNLALYHLTRTYLSPILPGAFDLVAWLLLTVLVAGCSYHYVEVPIMRLVRSKA